MGVDYSVQVSDAELKKLILDPKVILALTLNSKTDDGLPVITLSLPRASYEFRQLSVYTLDSPTFLKVLKNLSSNAGVLLETGAIVRLIPRSDAYGKVTFTLRVD